jgi:hypothetical protein
MENLTEEQQMMYAELTNPQQKLVDSAPEAQKGIIIQAYWLNNNSDEVINGGTQATTSTTVPPSGSSGIGGSNTVWTGVAGTAGQPADLSQSYAQGAIGVAGQRRLQILQKTGGGFETKPLPGSYSGFQPRVQGTPYGAMPANVRYFDGDEFEIANFKPEEIATIQQRMNKAGILGKKYRIGLADEETIAAFRKVLGQANTNGTNWTSALGTLVSTPQQGTGLPYRVSNPDDIRKVIQQTAGTVLGRSADAALVDRLVKSYQQLQIQEQQGNITSAGAQSQAPELRVFAEQQLREKSGADADAFRFAQAAKTVLGG